MECFSAILLFDAFSARKRNRVVHWITVTAVAFLDATLLNFAATTMPNYSKIVIAFALYFFMHRLLYTSNGMFSFYISIVFYPIKIARGRNGGLSLPDGYHLFKKMYMTPVQALALHRALLYVPDEIKKILETILTDFAW